MRSPTPQTVVSGVVVAQAWPRASLPRVMVTLASGRRRALLLKTSRSSGCSPAGAPPMLAWV